MTAVNGDNGRDARSNSRRRNAVRGNGNGVNGRLTRSAVYRWHRGIGAVSAILVVVLAITGPLLIHADALDLHERWVTSDLVLKFYNAEPARTPQGLEIDAGWLVSVDDMLILNRTLVARDAGGLRGAIQSDRAIAAATSDAVILLTPAGQVIERLRAESLPGTISRAGRSASGTLVIKSGGEILAAGPEYLTWQPVEATTITWLTPTEAIPAEVREAALAQYRDHRVTLHRLMADIHSGRILGSWGPYLMDAAAVALLLLAVSGFVNARRRRAACRRQSRSSDS